ncbi:MAG: DUF4465 domain-containing protein [Bacteroides sp.]|nr:DUF4465 domain-containing protein [Bacteroides sp.]MCM1413042.1 DUF4465 domain-containing protein [Bacteroides sp.]MCM1471748.1 DUF4465 domain-containing protein [Bacteroides sp.]
MKTNYYLKTLVAALSIATLCACSDDPEESTVNRRVLSFENTRAVVAGPTSYGANLYASYEGTKFIKGTEEVESGVYLEFGINPDATTGSIDFWNGGAVLSNWNYRSDAQGQAAGWWMTYDNQCSVYNVNSADGTNRGAGAEGTNHFLIINGYDNATYKTAASLNFSSRREYTVLSLMYCPTSYLYGTVTQGNAFGNDPGKTLKEVNGWFKMTVTGYDATGNTTGTVEKYICDYRNSVAPVEIADTWHVLDLSSLGRVNKLKFNFSGSDTGAWGLSTPAYMAIDNITLQLN